MLTAWNIHILKTLILKYSGNIIIPETVLPLLASVFTAQHLPHDRSSINVNLNKTELCFPKNHCSELSYFGHVFRSFISMGAFCKERTKRVGENGCLLPQKISFSEFSISLFCVLLLFYWPRDVRNGFRMRPVFNKEQMIYNLKKDLEIFQIFPPTIWHHEGFDPSHGIIEHFS